MLKGKKYCESCNVFPLVFDIFKRHTLQLFHDYFICLVGICTEGISTYPIYFLERTIVTYLDTDISRA